MGSETGTGVRGGRLDSALRSRPLPVTTIIVFHLLICRLVSAAAEHERDALKPAEFEYGKSSLSCDTKTNGS